MCRSFPRCPEAPRISPFLWGRWMNPQLESFSYDDAIVRKFLVATFVWGLVGMLVGLLIAMQLAMPSFNVSPFLTFGPLRPLHTNAVIFAFAGNAFFTAVRARHH